MTYRIDHKFDVEPGTERTVGVGAYVRAVGEDLGTGIVVGIGDHEILDEKTNKVYHQRVYHVHWLDLNEGTTYAFRPEATIAPSARAVPKFSSLEEAEAWMEAQTNPGHWTAAAQDATDSASDLDVALWKLLDEETGNEETG